MLRSTRWTALAAVVAVLWIPTAQKALAKGGKPQGGKPSTGRAQRLPTTPQAAPQTNWHPGLRVPSAPGGKSRSPSPRLRHGTTITKPGATYRTPGTKPGTIRQTHTETYRTPGTKPGRASSGDFRSPFRTPGTKPSSVSPGNFPARYRTPGTKPDSVVRGNFPSRYGVARPGVPKPSRRQTTIYTPTRRPSPERPRHRTYPRRHRPDHDGDFGFFVHIGGSIGGSMFYAPHLSH